MRSWLFVPADSERKIEKALQSEADCLILDLEDSVAPVAKDTAREMLMGMGKTLQTARPALYVRINPADDPNHPADLNVVTRLPISGVMLPKSNCGAAIKTLARALETCPDMKIAAIATETPGALFALGTYADASDRLSALTWGAEDLATAVGAETNTGPDGRYTDLFRLARSLCLAAAVHASVQPLDTVFTDIHNLEGLKAECEAARRDGYTGKMAIHPAQVPIINDVFTPSPDAIAWAEAVVELFEASPDAGVLSLDGQMIDRPHLRQAQSILARRR